MVGIYAHLLEANGRIPSADQIVFLTQGSEVLVAQPQVHREARPDAPGILEETGIARLTEVARRVALKNLGLSGHAGQVSLQPV